MSDRITCWRLVGSEPKDAYALVFSEAYKWHGLGGVAIAYRHADYNGRKDIWTLDGRAGRSVSGKHAPTHWMPLPQGPADLTGQSEAMQHGNSGMDTK